MSEIDANNCQARNCSTMMLARNARRPFAAFPDSYSRPTIEQPWDGYVPGCRVSPCPFLLDFQLRASSMKTFSKLLINGQPREEQSRFSDIRDFVFGAFANYSNYFEPQAIHAQATLVKSSRSSRGFPPRRFTGWKSVSTRHCVLGSTGDVLKHETAAYFCHRHR